MLQALAAAPRMVTTHINGNDIANSVAIQADQKIVVGGTADMDGNPNFAVVRYNTDGTLDASGAGFGTGGIANIDLGNGGAGSSRRRLFTGHSGRW